MYSPRLLAKGLPGRRKVAFLLAPAVAIIGFVLMLHYNNRLKNTRNAALAPQQFMLENGVERSRHIGSTVFAEMILPLVEGLHRQHYFATYDACYGLFVLNSLLLLRKVY
jgi:hypothetical protein